jgi:hypothetical protein
VLFAAVTGGSDVWHSAGAVDLVCGVACAGGGFGAAADGPAEATLAVGGRAVPEAAEAVEVAAWVGGLTRGFVMPSSGPSPTSSPLPKRCTTLASFASSSLLADARAALWMMIESQG